MNRVLVIALCLLAATQYGLLGDAPVWSHDDTQALTQLPTTLDLEKALALAERYSPRIAQAKAAVDGALGRVWEVGAQRLPRVDAVANYNQTDKGRRESFGEGIEQNPEAWIADLVLRQSLFTGGRLTADVRAARSRQDATDQLLRRVRHQVSLDLVEAFFGALLARDRIEVQEESLRLFEEQLELTRNRQASGAGTKFDVLRAEVSLENARPPLIRVRNDYRLSLDEMRRVIGLPYPPGHDAESLALEGDWPFPEITYSLQRALALAREHRPELLAQVSEITAAESDLKAARRARSPAIDFAGGYGLQNRAFGGDLTDSLEGWNVRIEARLPIFDSREIKGRVQQARARLASERAGQADLEASVEVGIRRAYSFWEESLQIFKTSNLVIKQAEEAHRLANVRFKAGASTQLDVLQAQFDLTRSRLERIRASHDYNVAVARLQRAMGIVKIGAALPAGDDASIPTPEPEPAKPTDATSQTPTP